MGALVTVRIVATRPDVTYTLRGAVVERATTLYPGGRYGELSLFLPRRVENQIGLAVGDKLQVYSGLFIAWEGKIATMELSLAPGMEGWRIAALGYWGSPLMTHYLRKPWSDQRLDQSTWIWDETRSAAEICDFDRRGRLYFAPKEQAWSKGMSAAVHYAVPTGHPVKRITFNYDFSETAVVNPDKVFFFNGTSYVDQADTYDGDETTADGITLTTTGYIYIGKRDTDWFSLLRFSIGASANDNAAALSAAYWNGTTWSALSITDGTSAGGAPLAGSGDIAFTRPANWVEAEVNSTTMYWVRLATSANLDAVTVNEIYCGQVMAWRLGMATQGGTAWSIMADEAGTVDMTFDTPATALFFYFDNIFTSTQRAPGNGTVYGAISGLTVYTETGNINGFEIARDLNSYVTELSSDTSLIGALEMDLSPYVVDPALPLADILTEVTSYGDEYGSLWAAYVTHSEEGGDGKPRLCLEKQPSLDSADYFLRLTDKNVTVGLTFAQDANEVYNYYLIEYTDAGGIQRHVTPEDDATLKDSASIAVYGRRDYTVQPATSSLAVAKYYARNLLARTKSLHWKTASITVAGYIRGQGGQHIPASRICAGHRLAIENFLADLNGDGLTFLVVGTEYSGVTDTCTIIVGMPDTLAAWLARKLRTLEGQVRTGQIAAAGVGSAVDVVAPTQPQNLVATAAGTDAVDLTWDESTDNVGIEGYGIYRDEVLIASVTEPGYTDTGLLAGTTYNYEVDAFDAAGNRSSISLDAQATTDTVESLTGFFVAPTGSSSGDGSLADPWSLSYAFSGAGGEIGAGDTVYFRGGTYSFPRMTFSLSGSSGNPIKFMPYPGEKPIFHVTDVSGNTIEIRSAAYVEFHRLTWTASNYDRTVETTTDTNQLHAFVIFNTSASYTQTSIKFYECTFKNAQAHGARPRSQRATGCGFYGCRFVFNGSSGQFHHGVYPQGGLGQDFDFVNCIFGDNSAIGFHGWGSSSTPINNFKIQKCVFYDPGSLYGNGISAILLGGTGSNRVYNAVIEDNRIFNKIGSPGSALRLGYGGGAEDCSVQRNHSVGLYWTLTDSYTDVTFANNRCYYGGSGMDSTSASILSSGSNEYDDESPNAADVYCDTYAWNNKRANLVIFNRDETATVTVNHAALTAGGLALTEGDAYELHNAQDYDGDVITGTYNGTSIVVPMTGHTVETPFDLPAPVSTFPQFGCFVLIVGGESEGEPDPGGGDPVTVNLTIGTGSNDGRWGTDGGYSASGSIIAIGRPSSGLYQHAWFRYPADIPENADIQDGEMTLDVGNTETNALVGKWRADLSVNPAAPANAAEADARPKTTAYVQWSLSGWEAGYVVVEGLADVIQEVVSQPTWEPGHAIIIYYIDDGSGSTNDMWIAAREHASGDEAGLQIVYTV
jgi:hypothetical protein